MSRDHLLRATAVAGGLAAMVFAAAAAGPRAGTAPAPEASPATAIFGNTPSRNMVSPETGLPGDWDVKSGRNVRWRQPLGSQSYGGPVVAGGKVFVGTNNEGPRDPAVTGDRGVVMAFQAADGEFLWQAAHPKLPAGRVHDWPLQGVCSTPYVEGDRLYYVSNRAEVICADTEGFADGENDGAFQGEVEAGAGARETAEDTVWKLDMIAELDVFPHNLAAGNPLVMGDLLYTVTGNGVDEGHVNIPSPRAPSFIAVDKRTGELVWESALPGSNILHGQWSNPTWASFDDREQVVFPGGDGWLYGLDPRSGELIWKFDCNPKDAVWELGGAGTRNNVIATPVVVGDMLYIGVGQDPEHGEGVGNFWAIRPRGTGDITATAVVWQRGGEDFHRTISTAAVHDGVVYAADLSGYLYALDALDGELLWTYDAYAAIWGSPFVADGKVYLGDEDGDVAILRAGPKLEVLAEPNMGASVYTTPVARDGVLYILARNMLYALEEGAGPQDGAAAPGGAGAGAR